MSALCASSWLATPSMAQVGPTAALDFLTTDYLSLRRHPRVTNASLERGSELETTLEAELAEFLRMEHVFVARSEWGAGVGAIATVVQSEDHVIFDARVRPCLRQGASSVTRHVHRAPRVDAKTVRDLCTEIRSF